MRGTDNSMLPAHRRLRAVVVAVALAAAGLTPIAAGALPAAHASARSSSARSSAPAEHRMAAAAASDACPPSAGPGQSTCAAIIGPATTTGTAPATTTPAGYGPADLQAAYGFQSSSAGMRQTVAVITSYDDPNAEADLKVYRSQYALPACTTADGCFKKTDQNGGTSYPAGNSAWATATSEALDTVSAVCPNCKILLVEASSGTIPDQGTAVNTAVSLGAKFIANDYDAPEGSADTGYDSSYFNHPGVAITAPAGDSGYGVTYPAASQYVTAVGGTTLTKTGTGVRGWSETAWSQTGSGCSAYDPKPSWQTDTGCTTRTVNDVAADADQSGSPVTLYDSYNQTGWLTGGGTAVAAAITAAAYALAGTPASGTYPASYPYAHTTALNDITSGSNGTCSNAYLCTAGTGYDGPAGNGTPSFTGAFGNTGAQAGAVYSDVFGRCLDDKGQSTANGNAIDIWTCNGSSAQSWINQANGTLQIYSKCLDVYGQGTANNTKVDLYTCTGKANQQWRVRSDGELVNPVSGRCLDDPGSGPDGTQLDIYDCVTGAANEHWIQPYSTPSSAGPITSGINSAKCIDDKGGSTSDGNPIVIYDCNGGTNQHWTIEPNGTLQVLSKCMDVVGYGTTNGAKIDLFSCNGQTNQQWRIQPGGEILNPESGKCFGVPAANTTNDTQLNLWTCEDIPEEIWNLPPVA